MLEAAAVDVRRARRSRTSRQAAQQRILSYDRAGDGHYDTVSAFIKSLRGNDPDAALYWLATMVAAGEDPRFIARRLIISASEDVGNADPHALQVARAAAGALDWVGLPEAQYALAQATAYIAAAPKSNRAGTAYWAAMDDVLRHGSLPVPNHLRSATWREKRDFGHGMGYVYPHDYVGADVEQQYLPDAARRAALLRAVRPRLREGRSPSAWPPRQARAPRTRSRRPDARPRPRGRKTDAMKVAGNVMRRREEGKRTIAARQKKDASGPGGRAPSRRAAARRA